MSNAPSHVDLVYRQVGGTHVLSTASIGGLVHLGGSTLEQVFRASGPALAAHVRQLSGVDAEYLPCMSLEEFTALQAAPGLAGSVLGLERVG